MIYKYTTWPFQFSALQLTITHAQRILAHRERTSGGCVEMEFPSEAVIRETVQRVLQEMQNGSSARESSAGTVIAPDTRAVPGSSVQRDHHYRIDPTQGCSSWYNTVLLRAQRPITIRVRTYVASYILNT